MNVEDEVYFTPAPFKEELNFDHWPRFYARWCNAFTVAKMGNSVYNTILEHAPFVGDRKKILVDVRNQYLQPGYRTAGYEIGEIEGWHVDLSHDPDALFHVYQIGVNRTEFRTNDIAVTELPHNAYGTYSSRHYHRGRVVEVEEFRLLVRFVETNDEEIENEVIPSGIQSYFPATYPPGSEEPTMITEQEYYQRFVDFAHLNLGKQK